MDMLPDYEIDKPPKGWKYGPFRVPKIGDWLLTYEGKPYKITKANKQYHFESHPTYIKIKRKSSK
jgi:hypothetical protein